MLSQGPFGLAQVGGELGVSFSNEDSSSHATSGQPMIIGQGFLGTVHIFAFLTCFAGVKNGIEII